MKLNFLFFLFLSIFLFANFEVHAHHTISHSSSSRSLAPVYQISNLSSGSVQPKSQVNFAYRYENIDSDFGDRNSIYFSFEHAWTSKFSTGVNLPIIGYNLNNLEQVKGFGDLGLHAKYTLLPKNSSGWSLISHLYLTLPTGNEHQNLGSDGFSLSPGLSLIKKWSKSYGYINGRPNFFFLDGEDTIFLDYSIGFGVEISRKGLPFDLVLSLDGNTYLKDSSFESSSTKLFLNPGVLFKPYDHVQILVFGFFDIADSLSVKSGVSVTQGSSELLADIGHGAGINFNYMFGQKK